MTGAALPQEQAIDGQNLTPLLKGTTKTFGDRPLFWHFPAYLQSYRDVTNEQCDVLFRSRPCSIVRIGDWKLHQYFEDESLELYNLSDDIGETINLAEQKPDRTAALLSKLEHRRDETRRPFQLRSTQNSILRRS